MPALLIDADYPSHVMINEHNLPMRAHNAFRVGGGSPARGRKVLR